MCRFAAIKGKWVEDRTVRYGGVSIEGLQPGTVRALLRLVGLLGGNGQLRQKFSRIMQFVNVELKSAENVEALRVLGQQLWNSRDTLLMDRDPMVLITMQNV